MQRGWAEACGLLISQTNAWGKVWSLYSCALSQVSAILGLTPAPVCGADWGCGCQADEATSIGKKPKEWGTPLSLSQPVPVTLNLSALGSLDHTRLCWEADLRIAGCLLSSIPGPCSLDTNITKPPYSKTGQQEVSPDIVKCSLGGGDKISLGWESLAWTAVPFAMNRFILDTSAGHSPCARLGGKGQEDLLVALNSLYLVDSQTCVEADIWCCTWRSNSSPRMALNQEKPV